MTNISECILMALANLKANKTRTFLTMLGIIIGISSVIAIMTVGSSLSGSLTNSLSSFGITNMTVSLTNKDDDNSSRMFMRNNYSESDLISQDMIDEYAYAYDNFIDYVLLSENIGSSTITSGENEASVTISGVNEDYKDYEEITMVTGRFINSEDLSEQRKICIVSDQFISDLGMSYYSAIGETIKVKISNYYQSLTIAGIYHYKLTTSEENSSDSITTTLYLPVTTAKYLNHSNDGYSSFTVVSKADIDTSWFLESSQDFFESFYTHNDSYTVSCSNMEEMLETMTEMLSTVTLAISCIAAISLLVGGIGVMNIMLVSITERTKEIGTRKALGATNNTIRLQFIVEAIMVCLIGGIIGIILGVLIGYVAANILGFVASPSISSIMFAVIFSIGIGIFFGYYPANKAAKLNPIDALRYE